MKKQKNNPDVFLQMEAALAATPRNAPVIMLVRHAEKEKMRAVPATVSGAEMYDDERMLTERGKSDAKIMGRLLMGRLVRIESSTVPRCLQTAQSAASGANFKGDIPKNRNLANGALSDSRDAFKRGKEAAGGYSKFMNNLAAGGRYPEINPLHSSVKKILSGLFSAAKPGINLAVSHDGILYLILAAIGVKVNSFGEECICYLEPLFLREKDGRMVFYYRNREGECNSSFSDIAKSANR